MRVLILTQHFAPEVTAGRFRVEAFADGLVRRGHEVQVICPVPNHPRGVVEDEYRGRAFMRRIVGGSRVTYLRVITSPEKTFWTRVAYYASYASLASVAGAFRRRPDVILASSPPLTVAAAGALLAARHRRPWLVDIRDLWPESAVALGELREGAWLAAAERLERAVYSRADCIVTTSEAFRRGIAERAPSDTPIEIIPNGTSGEWLEIGEREVDRSAVGLPGHPFIWAYAGNLGLAHGVEVAADAAGLLGDEYLLLVIGDGPRRAALEESARRLPPSAITLKGLMPARDAAAHLRAADAVLVTERQEHTVSAKLYDACAIGRPVIVACRGELRRIVEGEGIALAVPHGDPEALAEAVRRVRTDSELDERLTESARAFARRHLRERQAERLAELIESLADRS
jgi:colanic acid biosynthesis glycosyl transferase WcaI